MHVKQFMIVLSGLLVFFWISHLSPANIKPFRAAGSVPHIQPINHAVSCQQLTSRAFRSDMSTVEKLHALSELSAIRRNKDDVQECIWLSTYEETSVEFLIGTFDRPQELRRVLLALDTFVVEQYLVTVLFLASEDFQGKAYQSLIREFPSHKFVNRTTDNYFSLLRESIALSEATNFVIMSDDTVFIRPSHVRRLATLQNMLSVDTDVKYSVQLRSSSRDSRPEILAELLPTWGLPYVQVVNCSRVFRRFDTTNPDFGSCCYDRQIDGAMFTRKTIASEFDALEQFSPPTHPGELEGKWMQMTEHATWVDLTIFPSDRVVMNVGLGYGTVRDDRKHLEQKDQIESSAKNRREGAHALLRGCHLEQPPLGSYLQIDATHGSVESHLTC